MSNPSGLRSRLARATSWLPSSVDRRVRVAAWATLVAQTLIVATGGAVRLTGSGLGCPTWPRCTTDSFINTPEMGIHGVIEFGNRLLTFALIAVAVVMFAFVVKMRKERPELTRLAVAIALGIPLQGVIGGISVLVNLNPWVVGLHFVVSTVLVVLSTVLVYRVYRGVRGRFVSAPTWFVRLSWLTSVSVALTILVGVVVTGSGPHAGDGGSARNDLDPELMQHLHSYPAYLTLGLSILLLAMAVRLRLVRVVPFAIGLLSVEAVQILVGVTQARLGLPEILVGIHMVLACILASAMTAVVLSLRDAEPLQVTEPTQMPDVVSLDR